MPEIVAIRSFGAVSLLEHHANLITPYLRRYGPDSSFCEEDQDAKLVPKDELPSLVAEIEQRLAPAKPADVAKAVAMLFASFKVGDVLQDPKVFGQLMREELAEFPADVLEEGVRHARRTLKWLPSIAEMIEICAEIRAPLRQPLSVVQLMEKEYQRRAKREADRERWRLAQALRYKLEDPVWEITSVDELDAFERDHAADITQLTDIDRDGAYAVETLIARMRRHLGGDGSLTSALEFRRAAKARNENAEQMARATAAE
jgi:hypothetical protein